MKKLEIYHDEERDIVVIEGQKYSGDFFRFFSLPSGDQFFRFDNSGGVNQVVPVGLKLSAKPDSGIH